MTVRIHHGQLSLCKGRFVWPGTVMGDPFERAGALLVAELARTGWQAPVFDVDVHTAGSGKDVTRTVSSVSFDTPDGRLSLFYANHQYDGAYCLYRAEIDRKEVACFYDDGSGDRTEAAVERVLSSISAAVTRLSAIDDFPGQDDVTAEGDPVMRRLCHVEPVPVPDSFPVLYAWAERETAYRLVKEPDEVTAEEDYGLSGSGYRLAALGVSDGRPADPRVYEGYTYASDDPAIKAGQAIHGVRHGSFPVEVTLEHLNDVYVVDNAAFRHARAEDVRKAQAEGREQMTDAEIDRWTMATARTMVPWAEYAGGFEDPVYLIGRQTRSDEVRLMKGPVTVRLDGEGVVAAMSDSRTGTETELFRSRLRTIPHCREAARCAEDAARLLCVRATVSEEVQAILDNNPQPSLDGLLARP